ncbi:MAG TPA: ABC transporter ATP-binding protein [Streptosporangiaceae bacterium]|nr:ABC transporter ATP-binding protein [Streptosporangiaceae bacterium]
MNPASDVTPTIETIGLGRRYGRRWALRDCTLTLPQGHVIGLVGPNGAGKTTLLHIVAGLLEPTTGDVRVLGAGARDLRTLSRIGFVAQDKPLYPRFTVEDMLRMGGWLNPGWDRASALERLAGLDIPLEQRCGSLSGGQRAQVALAVALGKRPDLLLLDEPVANLDPLARRQFMQVLLEHVAATGMTVVLSSHLLADLERVWDYLVLMSASRIQLSAPTDELLHEHRVLTGPPNKADAIAATHAVVQSSITDRQATLLIRAAGPVHDPDWSVRPASLEEIVLAYMSTPLAGAVPALSLLGSAPKGSR